MNITINPVVPAEKNQDALSSKHLFSFVMLLDLMLTVWCVILMNTSENISALQGDLIISLVFICFGALYYLLFKEFVSTGFYLYDLFVHKTKVCHVYEYNYRCVGAVCLGWVVLDVLRPMVTDYLWTLNFLQVFFGLCALLLLIRVCLGFYLDFLYGEKKMKYDSVNDFYYEDEKNL